jgi:hypothetical protein
LPLLAKRSAHGRGLPAFVERELRAYVDCGVLARGFGRFRCPACGFERLVAFSCTHRGCRWKGAPSTRRLSNAAKEDLALTCPRL